MPGGADLAVFVIAPILKQLNCDHYQDDQTDDQGEIFIVNDFHRKKSRADAGEGPWHEPYNMSPLGMAAVVDDGKNVGKDEHRQQHAGRGLTCEEIGHETNGDDTDARKSGLGDPYHQSAQQQSCPLELVKLKHNIYH